jgi:glycosyltransferase involved in cell wall biosynthesis
MRIVFYPQSCIPIHARSLNERPLGGIETGIIRLAEALHVRGHNVTVYTSHPEPGDSEPPYEHISRAGSMRPADVFVCVREWIPLISEIPAQVKLFWTGDAADQIQNYGIGDKRVAALIDGLLTVSDWHASTLAQASGFPLEKTTVIRNGIAPELFNRSVARKPKQLIYSSTPFRGLELLPELYSRIRENHTDATLAVYSGLDVYRTESQRGYLDQLEARFRPIFEQLEALDGVTVHGNVTQERLAEAFLESSILCYPNTFPETSCITVMEAQAAGCVPVTSNLAALPETVGDAGQLIDGQPGSEAYKTAFVQAISNLLSDTARLTTLSTSARTRALHEHSWQQVAVRLENFLANTFNIF